MPLIKKSSNPFRQALAGLHYDASDLEGESRAVEGEAIPYGRGVTYGTNPAQCRLFEPASKFIGVSVARHDQEVSNGTHAARIDDESVVTETEELEIATQGRIWVRLSTGEAPAEGSPVHCVPTAGPEQGTFGSAAVAAGELVPNASFGILSKDGKLAVVNLNR